MAACVMVGARGAPLTVAELRMRSDHREIAFPLDGSTGEQYVGSCQVRGTITDAASGRAEVVPMGGHISLTLHAGRLLGIVAPLVALPALWFAVEAAATRLDVVESGGVLRRKPSTLRLRFDAIEIDIVGVGAILHTRVHTGQEEALLESIARERNTGSLDAAREASRYVIARRDGMTTYDSSGWPTEMFDEIRRQLGRRELPFDLAPGRLVVRTEDEAATDDVIADCEAGHGITPPVEPPAVAGDRPARPPELVTVDIGHWSDERLAAVSEILDTAGIGHELTDEHLVVAAADADRFAEAMRDDPYMR